MRKTWEVAQAYGDDLESYLVDGWEPFAVSRQLSYEYDEHRGCNVERNVEVYHLKRKREEAT